MALDLPSYLLGKSKGSGGTSDYADLTNKPSINGVTLSGNKTSADLGLSDTYFVDVTNTSSQDTINKIEEIYNRIVDGENLIIYFYNDAIKPAPTIYFRNQTRLYFYYTNSLGDVGNGNVPFASWRWTYDDSIKSFIVTRATTIQTTGKDNVLQKSNTTAFTPTGDYNPATKKYVDDAIASAITDALGGNY